MATYKLEVYGWEMEATAHTLTNEQVERIKQLMVEKGYDELWQCRWDLEEEGIVNDIHDGDLFHISYALNNGNVYFRVLNDKDEVILEFEEKDLGDYYELIGDDDFIEENYPHEGYLAIPEYMENVDNVLFTADENKGGIAEFLFESDEVPTAKDFCFLGGDIETPEGDWDFISKFFYKGQLLEVNDHLDNTGKAATVEIYTKDGNIIS